MDPELNPDDIERRSELTAEEQAASDKGQQTAFQQAFGDEGGAASSDPASTAAAARAPAASNAADAATSKTEGGTTQATDEDPFAGLNPKVREMLAEVPMLHRDLESLKGRLAPTQRKLSEVEKENQRLRAELDARGSATPATPAAPSDLETKVRGELPEVADLIEERVRAAVKDLQPAKRDDHVATNAATTIDDDPAVASLAKVHPDWDKTMVSTDYKLYVAAKGADYQKEILSTEDPVVIAASITEFKAHRQRTDQSTRDALDTGQRRQNRTERALEPGGRRPPPDEAQMTEHDAMVKAFNS